MTKLLPGLAALLLVATGTTAGGQDELPTFLVEQGNWWISRLGTNGCIAHNRPLPEFNAVPFNAMALLQGAGEQQPRLQAVYWPKSFERGQEFDLLVVPSSGKPFQYRVRAVSDYHVGGLAPLTEEEFGKLAASATVTIGGAETPQSLVIEAKELAEVGIWLDQCAG
jgi:hypothetical protein